MDTEKTYRQIIEKILTEYSQIRSSYGEIESQIVFDREHNHYMVMNVGWFRGRVHGCIIHLDIIDGKVWIQRDGTEDGIAYDLNEAGIPKEDIIIAFKEPHLRQYTGFGGSHAA